MKSLLKFIGFALFALLFIALSGFVTQTAWNYALVPQGLKEITLLQGLMLNVLGSSILGTFFQTRKNT